MNLTGNTTIDFLIGVVIVAVLIVGALEYLKNKKGQLAMADAHLPDKAAAALNAAVGVVPAIPQAWLDKFAAMEASLKAHIDEAVVKINTTPTPIAGTATITLTPAAPAAPGATGTGS